MNDIKHIFIINPAAGKGVESKKLADVITDACNAAQVDFQIYRTACAGDAVSFVKKQIDGRVCGEALRFYACGGDGTLSEVVSGAVNREASVKAGALTGVEVGCIPIGTGNDFVRNFSHSEFFSDVTKQILGDAMEIDCYCCGDGIYGINMINIGFDCEVVVKAAEFKRKRFIPKKLAYIAGILSVLKKNLGKKIRVRTSGGIDEYKEYQLVSAANGGFCGGGFHSAPGRSLDDGKLDVSLIDKVSRTTFIRLVGAYKKGTHLETKLGKRIVRYMHESSVSFEFSEPANICVDGEIIRRRRIDLSVMPRAVAFVIPVGCEIM